MLRLVTFIIVSAIITSRMLYAGDSAGQAGAYLKIGVGARALGMGGAFVAVSDDGSASFWNPAGLVQLNKNSITTMHSVLKFERTYNFINFVRPIKSKNSAWGISYIRYGVDDMNETHIWRYTDSTRTSITRDAIYGDPVILDGHVIPVLIGDEAFANDFNNTVNSYNDWKTKSYSDNDIEIFSVFDDLEWALSFSFAKIVNKRLYLGANIKYLKQDLFNYSADSFSGDIGILYNVNERFRMGLSIRDIGAKLKWDTPSGHSDRVPKTTTFGIAYNPNKKIVIATDYMNVENGENIVKFGIEGELKDNLLLRMGNNDGDFTAGLTIKSNDWSFDYAFGDEELGNEHKISASYSF